MPGSYSKVKLEEFPSRRACVCVQAFADGIDANAPLPKTAAPEQLLPLGVDPAGDALKDCRSSSPPKPQRNPS